MRSQDAVYAIAGVTSSALGRDMTWKFVKDNWTKLHSMYEGGFLLAHLVKLSIDSFADKKVIPEIKVCNNCKNPQDKSLKPYSLTSTHQQIQLPCLLLEVVNY